MKSRLNSITRSILIGIAAIGLMSMSAATANAQWEIDPRWIDTIKTGEIIGVVTYPQDAQNMCVATVNEFSQGAVQTTTISIRNGNWKLYALNAIGNRRHRQGLMSMCDLLLRGLQLGRVKIGIGGNVRQVGLAVDAPVDYTNKLDLTNACAGSVCELSGTIKAIVAGPGDDMSPEPYMSDECMASMEVNGQIVEIRVPGDIYIYAAPQDYQHVGKREACDALAAGFASGLVTKVRGEVAGPHSMSIENQLNVTVGRAPVASPAMEYSTLPLFESSFSPSIQMLPQGIRQEGIRQGPKLIK